MESRNLILKAVNLMKSYGGYGTYVNAVDRVTIPFYERDFTAIVGPSGSGKSTLLHLLGGIDIPSGGEVWVYPEGEARGHEINLYALSSRKLAKYRGSNFGFVFQNYALLPVLTAWENVMTPSVYNGIPFNEDYALSLFDRLGLAERIHHLPSELSGGEQQRVALIRAMVSRPRILFADEPTGNLDRKNGQALIRLLFELRDEQNVTVILVTHDPEAAAMADRTVHMEDGRVTEVR